MLTLIQITNKLQNFFETHAQINTVKVESDFDFNAESALIYPVVNLAYIDSNIANKAMNHRIEVTIADLVNKEIEQHDLQIESDALLIAEDFFAWLQEQMDFDFQKSTSIQPFADNAADRTSGVVFTITLQTIRPQNTCQIPEKLWNI